ncbi:MAG: hypothetical protein CFH01_01715 [Alphaproteobacteria bacterium MarineAlpha2_Bin1]|nr:MAG: hypothetical protein CFH01_01715 [Alphaproteobacteria bacterium MarineAlpha2_Bin1]|tara:strand:- start:1559 stop:1990 length:432 start_codon:yes stop_codon:yes gene_type:complete
MNFLNKKNIIQNIEEYDLKDFKKNDYWGMHLIVDMENCKKRLIQDKDNIYNFSKNLVATIEMKPFGEPIIEYFATDNPKAAGFSLIQLIETSNISAHFADNSQSVFLDVFSCKSFIPKKVVEVAKNYFMPKKTTSKIILRGVE